MGANVGLIEKSGTWYSYKGERVGQGRENVKKLLKEKPELAAELDAEIRQGRVRASGRKPDAEPEAKPSRPRNRKPKPGKARQSPRPIAERRGRWGAFRAEGMPGAAARRAPMPAKRIPERVRIDRRRTGFDPGSLVYVGKPKTGKPRITVLDYDGENFLEKEAASSRSASPSATPPRSPGSTSTASTIRRSSRRSAAISASTR